MGVRSKGRLERSVVGSWLGAGGCMALRCAVQPTSPRPPQRAAPAFAAQHCPSPLHPAVPACLAGSSAFPPPVHLAVPPAALTLQPSAPALPVMMHTAPQPGLDVTKQPAPTLATNKSAFTGQRLLNNAASAIPQPTHSMTRPQQPSQQSKQPAPKHSRQQAKHAQQHKAQARCVPSGGVGGVE